MAFLFSSQAGRLHPKKTLTVDVYVARLDQGLLTPGTKALGFKTYVSEEPTSPFLLDEARYIEQFRAHWTEAIKQVAKDFGVQFEEGLSLIGRVESLDASLPPAGNAIATTLPAEPPSDMATRPTIQVSGLSSVPEDPVSTTSSPGGITRAERKNAVLRKLRPPPLTHEWALWHDRLGRKSTKFIVSEKNNSLFAQMIHGRHESLIKNAQNASHDHATSDSNGHVTDQPTEPDYEASLKKMIEISTVQTFWETFNNFPLDTLVLRDSLYLFKKTVKPVWEDVRNVRGGSWTFRVSKAQSADAWKYVQLMAIGEALQDAVEPGDDICGVGLSIRFNSHLISVWNRDGSNQKSIDAILATVLDQLPDEMKPTPQNYYYKKHSEHAGFGGENKAETKA